MLVRGLLRQVSVVSAVAILITAVTACGDETNDSAGGAGDDRDDRAAEVLREADRDLDFPLYAPFELHAMEPSVDAPPGDLNPPFVTMNLVDPEEPQRRIQFHQEKGPPGTVAPPPNIEDERTVDIQGHDAELITGSREGREMVLLQWDMGEQSFVLAATDVDVDRVVQIAESIEPIDED